MNDSSRQAFLKQLLSSSARIVGSAPVQIQPLERFHSENFSFFPWINSLAVNLTHSWMIWYCGLECSAQRLHSWRSLNWLAIERLSLFDHVSTMHRSRMFKKVVPVTKENHSHLFVKGTDNFLFAKDFHIAPIALKEFFRAAAYYPNSFLEESS